MNQGEQYGSARRINVDYTPEGSSPEVIIEGEFDPEAYASSIFFITQFLKYQDELITSELRENIAYLQSVTQVELLDLRSEIAAYQREEKQRLVYSPDDSSFDHLVFFACSDTVQSSEQ
jgi:hypothetical protein